MSTDLPTLSVVMTSYNYAHFISEALDSILRQSYQPIEIIVIDDASTDESVRVIEGFTRKSHEIVLVTNERNRGALYSGNRGLQLARGDYVYFAAADDKILPSFFEKSMDAFRRYPDAGLSFADYLLLGEPRGTIREKRLGLSQHEEFFSGAQLSEILSSGEIAIGGQSIIMNRAALMEIGGFDERLGFQADSFIDFVVGFRYGVIYIPEALAVARIHSGCGHLVSNKQSREQRRILRKMVSLLNSERYRDVRPMFRAAAILSRFKMEAIKGLIAEREARDFLTFRLIRRALWAEIRYRLGPLAPTGIKNLYDRAYYVRRRCALRVLLYRSYYKRGKSSQEDSEQRHRFV